MYTLLFKTTCSGVFFATIPEGPGVLSNFKAASVVAFMLYEINAGVSSTAGVFCNIGASQENQMSSKCL